MTCKPFILMLLILWPLSAVSQDPIPVPYNLHGKHQINLSIGLLSTTGSAVRTDIHGTKVSSDASDFLGSIGYSYWFENDLALHLSVGVSDADSKVTTQYTSTDTESAVVIPVLVGVKFRPVKLHTEEKLRLFGAVDVGSWFGVVSRSRKGLSTTTESYVESAFGGRLGVGMDLSLGRTFLLGWEAGYRLVSDFDRRIGSEKNYSSPDFMISFGLLLGRGK